MSEINKNIDDIPSLKSFTEETNLLKDSMIKEEITNINYIKLKIAGKEYYEKDLKSLKKSYDKLLQLWLERKDIYDKTWIDLKYLTYIYSNYAKDILLKRKNLYENKTSFWIIKEHLLNPKRYIEALFFLVNSWEISFLKENQLDKNYAKELLEQFPQYREFYSKEEIKNLAKVFEIKELYDEMEKKIEKEKSLKLKWDKIFSRKKLLNTKK